MSPAGYWPQLRAAVEAGADSVYFGLKHFSARAKVGFSLDELPEAIRLLHGRGVKGFVTFNTLVFDHELREAAEAIASIAGAGADAIIVQDAAAALLARRVAPGLDVHGSTQMSVTGAEGVEMARRLGVTRVVLARELSLPEIRAIRERTDCELEVFVHGALCVSYSGQCFSSEAWGGRSANRGQCAQACRLPYEMIVDGVARPLADARYLLSPGDLYTLRHIPELVASGVSSLKIEGRYKDSEYVAIVTAAYRKAVDEAWAGRDAVPGPHEELALEQVYSRGLGPHFMAGTNHQTVVSGRAPRHRGVGIGEVVSVSFDSVTVRTSPAHDIAPLKPGDGVVFDAASWRSPSETEEGGRVFEVLPAGHGIVEPRFANGAVDFARIRPGDLVWRTHDPAVDKLARPYLEPGAPVRRQPVHVRAIVREGEPLVCEWRLNGALVVAQSAESLDASRTNPATREFVREQLDRLGATPYEIASFDVDIAGSPFAPASLLNRLRREAVEKLQAQQQRVDRSPGEPAAEAIAALLPRVPGIAGDAGRPRLHLLIRFPSQIEAAIDARPASVTLDYLDLYGLRPSVDRLRAAGIAPRVASPRVLKPGEERIVSFLRKLECPLLVRSAGLLRELGGAGHAELTGDFSLNAANAISTRAMLEWGLARITPSHDLNGAQVAALARAVGGAAIEAVAYQHLPVFHTEHCVFCRFLSTGTSYKDCGRPCETHRVALRDERGREHPVMADVGCRNTVFGAEAQHAAAHLPEWLRAGIRDFRLEFVHEPPDQVGAVARAFERALDGELAASLLERELARIAPCGVTEGSLFTPAGYLQLPVLQ